jgi:hypothetical protein
MLVLLLAGCRLGIMGQEDDAIRHNDLDIHVDARP